MRRFKSHLVSMIPAVVLAVMFVVPQSAVVLAGSSPEDDFVLVASLKFDPKINGYGFPNYGNEHQWQDDLGTADLIRYFGVKAVCKTGDNAKNCVLKAAAREWMLQELKGMDGGHCEGMAATSLRFSSGLPFRGLISPQNFQTGATTPFTLKRDQSIDNYIAYYFVTQGFQEVAVPSKETAAQGPVAVAKTLIDSFKTGKDTFSLGFYMWDPKTGRTWNGHAITPFAVSESASQYRIHVYDNNYPGETRYVIIDKAGKQNWKYVTSTNPKEPANEYFGNTDSKTLELTSTANREGRCFDAPFAPDDPKATGCGIENVAPQKPANPTTPPTVQPTKPAEKPDVKPVTTTDEDGESVEFSLTGDGDLLIVDDDGKRLGYDPKSDRFYDEIPGAIVNYTVGGLGKDLPNYTLPYRSDGSPYTIVFSGKHTDGESNFDFNYSAPGLTVGFNGVRLDAGETLEASVSPNGEELSFTGSADGEAPQIYYSFDSDEEGGASYIAEVEGGALGAGKTLRANFDFDAGRMYFSDDDGNEDEFDVELIRINGDGSEQVYSKNNLNIGKGDRYMMDFGKWDGKGEMCFEEDEDGDGFEDEQCVEEDSDGPGADISSVLLRSAPFAFARAMYGR